MTDADIERYFRFAEMHIDPREQDGIEYFERIDIELAARIEANAMKE